MSDNVTRYELEQGRSHDSAALMKADRMGDYVLYTDFSRVEAERDRLDAHLKATTEDLEYTLKRCDTLKARVVRLETALTVSGVPIPHEDS